VLPPPGPFSLAGLGETVPDPHPTQVVTRAPEAIFDQDESAKKTKPVAAPTRAAASDADRPRAMGPLIIGAVLILVVAGAVFALTRPQAGATVTVPNLQGMKEAAAQTTANQSGLLVSSTERTADDPAGVIVSQKPKAGYFLGRGGTVKLIVSKGPKPVALPAVAGKPEAEALAALQQALFVPVVVRQFNETVPKGATVGTDPSGKAAPDSKVTLVISDGPAPVTVPSVYKRPYAEAATIIQNARLTPKREDAYSDSVAAGLVVRTIPAAAEKVPRDSEVRVIVSKGTDIVLVPSLTGLTIDAATALAQKSGLTVAVQGAYSPGKKVRAQSPAKGAPIRRGQQVTLIF
jgi:serine/threonine-protein kinase